MVEIQRYSHPTKQKLNEKTAPSIRLPNMLKPVNALEDGNIHALNSIENRISSDIVQA